MLLDRLLRALDVQVQGFALCTLKTEERHHFGRAELAGVHYVVAGSGLMKMSNGFKVELKPHMFLVTPPNIDWEILPTDKADSGLHALGPVCQRVPKDWQRVGQGNEQDCSLVMLCGQVQALYRNAVGLFDLMDRALVMDFAEDTPTQIHFNELLEDLAHERPGHLGLADNLLQRCFMRLLQQECTTGDCRLPWLSALEDERLSRVLQEMTENKRGGCSLEGLAELAGMSRASFATHFQNVFGKPAIAFYNDLRLREAAKVLETTDWPIKRVAQHIGYASRSHFESSFKKFSGESPSTYRAAMR